MTINVVDSHKSYKVVSYDDKATEQLAVATAQRSATYCISMLMPSGLLRLISPTALWSRNAWIYKRVLVKTAALLLQPPE